MAIRQGNREQISFLPPCVEDYISEDDPVRAYDAMLDSMDLKELGLEINPQKVGNPQYDPILMLKLLVYGCSYGVDSSRKLEQAVYHNLSFIWLLGGLKPDHKTIANFRKNNTDVLSNVLKQSVRICIQLDLIKGNQLFVDGTKIRGNCSRGNTKKKSSLKKQLVAIDKRIKQIVENFDLGEKEDNPSLVEMPEELKSKRKLRDKISGILEKMDKEGLDKINTTDGDSVMFRGRQGSHSGYNGQVVVDGEHGLIVNADVVSANHDKNQFTEQISKANENLDAVCETAVADAGYFKVDDLKRTSDQGIDVIVPSTKQATKDTKEDPFDKDHFTYDQERDEYICPENKRLVHSNFIKIKNQHRYRMKHKKDCFRCKFYGVCTKNKKGRMIYRLVNEDFKHRIAKRYASDVGQRIYARRKEVGELPFGHIKRNLNGSRFLLRGLNHVRGEFAVLASCFNMRRLITLSGGVRPLLSNLARISPLEAA